jgi:hypothetical protein
VEIDFNCMPIEELERLLSIANAELEKALLEGADWENLSRRRDFITQMHHVIHKRKYPLTDIRP